MKSSTKIIIFPEADLLTIEAQNALLKMLEEPPEFVTFLLCSENEESLLPTIISRCTIVTDINKQKGLSAEDLSAFQDTYQTLSGLSLSEALELAESVAKNKDSAVIWLEKIIMAGRTVLLDEALKNNTGSGNTRILRQLQSTYQDIKKTNANTRLMLESCLLSLR